MANRKFKQAWVPTPLHKDGPRRTRPATLPPPPGFMRRMFAIVWYFTRVVYWESVRLLFRRPRSVTYAKAARDLFERFGGGWVILARLASLRSEFLGEEFCIELARTEDKARPLPFAVIKKCVETELASVGLQFDEVFSEFDEQPLVSRTFVQAHRATLRESKRAVVVRVRAPDADRRAASDLRYIRLMFSFFKWFDIDPYMRWDDLVFEVANSTEDQIDLRTEVSELRKIGRTLRPRRIYIPLVFRKLCTRGLLVNEFIDGVSLGDLQKSAADEPDRCAEWLHENRIKKTRIWTRLFNAHHEMLFEKNQFYTELTADSIVLLKSNRLAFVSLGTVGTIDVDIIRKYKRLYEYLIDEDYTKVCDTYLQMGPVLPYKEISDMRQAAMRTLRAWKSRTYVKSFRYQDKSLTSAANRLAFCASQHELPAFWNLARLQTAERILDGSFQFLDSTKNSIAALKRYRAAAQRRSIKRAATRNVRKRIDSAVDTAQLNMQLLENFEHDGEYLRRRLENAQGKIGRVSQVLGRMLLLVGKVALIGLAAMVAMYFQNKSSTTASFFAHNTLGRFLNRLTPQSKLGWALLIGGLFLARRVLVRLARQLFSTEVRPSDVT